MTANGRIWTETQTAEYFGRSLSWFRRRKERLEASGFPRVDPDLGGRDSIAVMRFVDDKLKRNRSMTSQADLLRKRAEAIARGSR